MRTVLSRGLEAIISHWSIPSSVSKPLQSVLCEQGGKGSGSGGGEVGEVERWRGERCPVVPMSVDGVVESSQGLESARPRSRSRRLL